MRYNKDMAGKRMGTAWILLPVLAVAAALPGLPQNADRFPPFITPNADYFITRLGVLPEIEPASYRLEIKGLVQTPKAFTLEELYALPMTEIPLTVECIGNGAGGALVSTAVWKGVRLDDLLRPLGVSERATGIRYAAADDYYASHTMAQVRENGVLVALFMNGEPLPRLHGFPVRILNPGYYGVKQPAWITSIEVIDKPVKDYWEDNGWDCSPPMPADSVFFFPKDRSAVKRNQPVKFGGAAFGGTRVARVELTIDGGKTWTEAAIVKKMDADNVWVFWEAELVFPAAKDYLVRARATDVRGRSQPENDSDFADGTDEWPALRLRVKR